MPNGLRRILPTVFVAILLHTDASLAGARCEDVASRGFLKVLTINLLFSEVDQRDERLEILAQFIRRNEVDLILLQEVVSGRLADTSNSAKDLQRKIERGGLSYDRESALVTGVSGLLKVGNAILSRCRIVSAKEEKLPKVSELEVRGINVKLRRVVQVARIEIPGFGRSHVYNTHLCAACSFPDLGKQTDALLHIVRDNQESYSATTPIILGGDLNINRLNRLADEKSLYESIVAVEFTDAYAQSKNAPLDALCDRDPMDGSPVPDEHCTIGTGITELSDSNPKRIDYIFTRNYGWALRSSQVVFNSVVRPRGGVKGKTVSDHAGVYVQVKLR